MTRTGRDEQEVFVEEKKNPFVPYVPYVPYVLFLWLALRDIVFSFFLTLKPVTVDLPFFDWAAMRPSRVGRYCINSF